MTSAACIVKRRAIMLVQHENRREDKKDAIAMYAAMKTRRET